MSQTNEWNLTAMDGEDTLQGKYLIFTLGSELYGIEIRYVTDIIGVQPITQVPEMPDYIKGIINLRGKIIPVMDARLRFKKAEREYDSETCIIVLDIGDVSVGLIVDGVSEVLTMKDEDIAPPPDIRRGGSKYINGIGKTGDGITLLLNCLRLLSDGELDALGALASM